MYYSFKCSFKIFGRFEYIFPIYEKNINFKTLVRIRVFRGRIRIYTFPKGRIRTTLLMLGLNVFVTECREEAWEAARRADSRRQD